MSSPQPDPATGPAEAIGTPPPPLRRSSTDRVFAGVCGGVARRFGVSALAVRVVFSVLVLTGIGVAVYVVIAIACPADDDPRPTGVLRVVAALVAGLAALAVSAEMLHALGIGRYALGGSGSLLLIVFLAGLGAALVLGRGQPVAAGGETTAPPARPALRRMPRLHPPVLLLLTVAVAAMAAIGTWFATDGPAGENAIGAMLAAALIAVGLGICLGAWRGRSLVLVPLALVLAAPLALAGLANVSLTLGRDNPGVIAGADSPERTVVLKQGAGPVEVRSAAVTAGLRTLTVRKGLGRVEVIVDRSIPIRLDVVAVGGQVTIDDYASNMFRGFRTLERHSFFLPAAGGAATAPLDLKVEVGFGSVLVEHGLPPMAVAPSLADRLKALRTQLLADIAARRALLVSDRRALRGLSAAYIVTLRRLAGDPAAAAPPALRLPDPFWRAVTPATAGLTAADPALRHLDRLRVLRFNLLRAAWRTHSVARGLHDQRVRLARLERTIAAAETKAARP
jgi:phage shock protein PspC (stress-responsive transcriptional regulator)